MEIGHIGGQRLWYRPQAAETTATELASGRVPADGGALKRPILKENNKDPVVLVRDIERAATLSQPQRVPAHGYFTVHTCGLHHISAIFMFSQKGLGARQPIFSQKGCLVEWAWLLGSLYSGRRGV